MSNMLVVVEEEVVATLVEEDLVGVEDAPAAVVERVDPEAEVPAVVAVAGAPAAELLADIEALECPRQ